MTDAPVQPADVGLAFPDWQPGQWETVAEVVAQFAQHRVVVVEAPTGSGKSGVSYAVADLLGARRTVVLTHQKILQHQYVNLPLTAGRSPVHQVTGRANHRCLMQPTQASEAPCTVAVAELCAEYGNCPYFKQVHAAEKAPFVCLNYAYWLIDARGRRRFAGRNDIDLLVADECQELETSLQRRVEIILAAQTFRRVGIDLPVIDNNHAAWRAWASRVADRFYMEAHKKVDINAPQGEVLRAAAVRTVYDRCVQLEGLDGDWLIDQDLTSATFRPTWVREFGKAYVFDHAKHVLLMSATVLDPGLFAEGLGLDPAEVGFVRVPSTFPLKNRPVVVRPAANASGARAAEERGRLVRAVDQVLAAHPTHKGVVHTGNYAVAQAILGGSRFRNRLVTHDQGNRAQVVAQFKASRKPLVLVSPSMTTGLDLPGDQARFQVVAKLPFPDLGNEQVARRMKLIQDPVTREWVPNPRGQTWYNWVTACSFMQSCGRAVRSPTDWATTYVLDAAFLRWWPRVRRMFPEWFVAAVRVEPVTNVLADLAAAGG